MKVLVTGAAGMLGADLCAVLASKGHQVVAASRSTLDITDWPSVRAVFGDERPDLVIHAAAYTDVDQAEASPELNDRVNVVGTWNVALGCAHSRAQLVYISSGGIFDGNKAAPYTELDTPNPLTRYHRSKHKAEHIVAVTLREHFILRPGWLFGGHGGHRKNFVAQRYHEASRNAVLHSANDRFGTPTSTEDFAEATLAIVQEQAFGLYHVANAGHCSRYDYVQACVEAFGLPTQVVPVSSDRFPRRAPVPAWEALDNYMMRLRGMVPVRPWREALEDYIRNRLLPELNGGRVAP